MGDLLIKVRIFPKIATSTEACEVIMVNQINNIKILTYLEFDQIFFFALFIFLNGEEEH